MGLLKLEGGSQDRSAVEDLERLIETEQRLDEALRRAREEATELMRAAQVAVRDREVKLESEIEAAGRKLEADLAAERERRERELTRETGLQVERYETVSEDRIGAAAREVVDRLLGGEGGA